MFAKLLIVLVAAALVVGMVAHDSHGAGPERVRRQADRHALVDRRPRYGGDPRDGVWKLEQPNHLHSATITPGQKLVLPS